MPHEIILNRLARFRKLLEKSSLDAFVLFVQERANGESCRYISGFTGSSAALVIDKKRAVLISDGRYKTQAGAQSPFEFVLVSKAPEKEAMKILSDGKFRKVGFEAEKISHAMYKKNFATLPIVWEDASQLIPSLRRAKFPEEINALVNAGKIAFEAYKKSLEKVRVGMSEREFANLLLYTIKDMGADDGWRHDDFIVASGERGALPHGRASDRAFRAGDLVTVDFGATVEGYMSDLTRNFSLGKPSEKSAQICAVLIEAHNAAARALAPGKSCKEIDAVARKIITDEGFGAQFSHGLGHGLGLEVHEAPRLSPTSSDTLAVGDVVTIEPGIYIEGWGGLRIEDDYLITQEGSVCLTPDKEVDIVDVGVD